MIIKNLLNKFKNNKNNKYILTFKVKRNLSSLNNKINFIKYLQLKDLKILSLKIYFNMIQFINL